MNSEPHSVADDQVRSAFQRWKNLEEEKARIGDDLKELFAEQKAFGHDAKAMRAAFRLKVKMDEARPEDAEHEALVDTYLAALSAPSRAYTRGAREERADAGLSILTKHEDIRTSDGSPSVSSSLPTREAEESVVPHSPATANETVGGFPVAAAPTNAEETGGVDADKIEYPKPQQEKETIAASSSDQPLTGGDHEVASSAQRASELVTGEGAASALPAGGIVIESVPPAPMKRPDFATCFPELSNAAYSHLHDEIQATGICAPIVRHGDVILDGWDRYNISRELGFNYPVQLYSGNDVLLDVIEWQRASRNFTPAQEKKIATDLAKEIPHRADDIMAAFGLADEAMEAAE